MNLKVEWLLALALTFSLSACQKTPVDKPVAEMTDEELVVKQKYDLNQLRKEAERFGLRGRERDFIVLGFAKKEASFIEANRRLGMFPDAPTQPQLTPNQLDDWIAAKTPQDSTTTYEEPKPKPAPRDADADAQRIEDERLLGEASRASGAAKPKSGDQQSRDIELLDRLHNSM